MEEEKEIPTEGEKYLSDLSLRMQQGWCGFSDVQAAAVLGWEIGKLITEIETGRRSGTINFFLETSVVAVVTSLRDVAKRSHFDDGVVEATMRTDDSPAGTPLRSWCACPAQNQEDLAPKIAEVSVAMAVHHNVCYLALVNVLIEAARAITRDHAMSDEGFASLVSTILAGERTDIAERH